MKISGKHIWFVSHQAKMGGAERSLLEMIDLFTEMGGVCHVIVPDYGAFTEKLADRGVHFVKVHYRWWVSLNRNGFRRIARKVVNYFANRKITSILSDFGADLVITNTITVPVGAMAAKRLNIPHIWVIREFGEEDHGLIFDEGINKATRDMDTWSNAIFINSKAVIEKYKSWFSEEKIQLLYPYFSPPEIKKPKHQDMKGRFVIVGAIQPGKGQLIAIDAISHLNNEGVSVSLDIYGDGRPEYVTEMQERIEFLKAERFVKWHGKIPSAWEKIYMADGLLVCSRCEAFGRITVEGMLMKTPVIGAASGGTKELIGENEERGYLFRTNDLNDLISVLKKVMNDDEERRKKVVQAKEWTDTTFTKERYKEAVENVLKKL